MIKDVLRYTPPKTWGVLCIDIWDNNGANDTFYQRAVAKLSQYNIGLVVNCSTDIKLDYSDKSVFNTLDQYVWRPRITDVNKVDTLQEMQLNLLKMSGRQATSKIINDKLFDNNSLCLSSKHTFQYHVDTYYPEIRDWIILGSAWKICVHHGPLGITTLFKIPTCSFNIFPDWSIQNEDGSALTTYQVDEDEYVWASIDEGGYRLVAKMGGKWTRD